VVLETPSQQPKRRPSPRVIVWSVLVALAVGFIAQNTRTDKISILFWDVRAPAWIWLVAVFAFGFVTGWLLWQVRRSTADRGAGRPPATTGTEHQHEAM
jgi:uncharacterized integral membrane protein